jgi:hypothetical protein
MQTRLVQFKIFAEMKFDLEWVSTQSNNEVKQIGFSQNNEKHVYKILAKANDWNEDFVHQMNLVGIQDMDAGKIGTIQNLFRNEN